MSGTLLDRDRIQAQTYVEQATNLPLNHLAFNTAVSAATPTEILSVVSISHRPLALFIMSPVTAKTFALSLLERVKEYEAMAGAEVKTTYEMLAAREITAP
jgi:hypothetical protein